MSLHPESRKRESVCEYVNESMKRNLYKIFGIISLVFITMSVMAWNSMFEHEEVFSFDKCMYYLYNHDNNNN